MNPREKPGLAQLTSAMLTRGTEKLNALEFAAQIEDVGASLSAIADTLTVDLNGQAQSKDLDRLMDLLAEMLLHPTFPAADLERLKGQLIATLEEEKDDPSSLANRAFERRIYPEGNPLRPVTLDEAEKGVQSLTREDLLDFYRRQYGPDRMILVVTGDVKADRVREALQSRLGAWAKNPAAQDVPSLTVPVQEKAVRETIQVPEKSETAIVLGHAGGLKRSDPDFYAAQVLNLVLGGGGALNSRLGTVVRDQQGLAYGIGSFFDASLYPGPFEIALGTNPANAEKAIRSTEAEVKRILEQGVTQREVDEAVAYLTGRFPLRLETNQGLAEMLWTMEFFHLGPDYIEKYPSYYRAVTVAQANEAAKKHLRPDRATLVVAGTVPDTGTPRQ